MFTFSYTCSVSPFGRVLVSTNLYPGISFLGCSPTSVVVPGITFPSLSLNTVVTVVTFSYTCSISPFGSFLVSTNLYPGISLLGFSPSSVDSTDLLSLSTVIRLPSLSLKNVLTLSYTCSVSPFSRVLVSTNLYPGISFLGVVPSSVSVPGITCPSGSTNDVVTFS